MPPRRDKLDAVIPDERILSAAPVDDDLQTELSLRPRLLRE